MEDQEGSPDRTHCSSSLTDPASTDDAVSRDLILEQLQKGLLIPNDLGSSSLSNCSNQDLNSELSQLRETGQEMLQLDFFFLTFF